MKKIAKPLSPAKEWARKRNWKKHQLSGIMANLATLSHCPTLLIFEQVSVLALFRRTKTVLENWDNNNKESKEAYLERFNK